MLKVGQTGGEGQVGAADVPAGALLDEIASEGARWMPAVALRAEADAYIDQFIGELDEGAHRFVMRNGHHEPRTVLCAAGGRRPCAAGQRQAGSTR